MIIRHLTIIKLLVLLFTTTSCSAKTKKSEKDYSPMHRSEIMLRNAIGDSISNIILRANTIEIGCDSAIITKLGSNDRSIIRYLVTDSCNYTADTEVFGQFHAYLFAKFTSKKRTITAQYDFRLHKWMLIGENNKLLRRFDLLNMEILKYALLAFPQNQKLIEIFKEQQEK